MRRPLIAGNWKMYTSLDEAKSLATAIVSIAAQQSERDILLAPPFTSLNTVADIVKKTPNLYLAGQNVAWDKEGAFTGEISPVMLKEVGCAMAIIGHSERRHIFGEDDELINKRVLGAARYGITPILCVGEKLEEREAGRTMAVLEGQVRKGVNNLNITSGKDLVIAYEPVWAIGTGKTASDDQAQEAHAFIRSLSADIFEKIIASQIRIWWLRQTGQRRWVDGQAGY
jgi:triosephosphate isomerase